MPRAKSLICVITGRWGRLQPVSPARTSPQMPLQIGKLRHPGRPPVPRPLHMPYQIRKLRHTRGTGFNLQRASPVSSFPHHHTCHLKSANCVTPGGQVSTCNALQPVSSFPHHHTRHLKSANCVTGGGRFQPATRFSPSLLHRTPRSNTPICVIGRATRRHRP